MSKTKVEPVAPATTASAATSETEVDQIHRIARAHGLDETALEQLITESRTEAGRRRRRLSDARIDEFVHVLGANQ